jgi:hypothetical protein
MSVALQETNLYKPSMKLLGGAIFLAAISLIGCGTANQIGHAITSPVRYVLNEPEPAPIPNPSDVTNPGRPLPVTSPTPHLASRRSSSGSHRTSSSATPAKAASSSAPSPAVAQFPVAKAVPGRPGLVQNPFGGGYIDVSGYAPGSKVKDPGTQKIFIVP